MNVFHEYETIYVLTPDLTEEAQHAVSNKLLDVIQSAGGAVLYTEHWGSRKLAYPIQKNAQRHARGQYIYLVYAAPGASVVELERNLRLEDATLRFLTVKVAEDVDLEQRKVDAPEEYAKRKTQQIHVGGPMDDDEVDYSDHDEDEDYS